VTLFSKIISGEVATEKLYEDEHTIVINDINPQAPVHVLVIPKQEVKDMSEVNNEIMGFCLKTIQHIVKTLNINSDGYRVVTNIGSNGGQSIPHLHFHILGGVRLTHNLN
jgi:histidine triad (HIT) family protein